MLIGHSGIDRQFGLAVGLTKCNRRMAEIRHFVHKISDMVRFCENLEKSKTKSCENSVQFCGFMAKFDFGGGRGFDFGRGKGCWVRLGSENGRLGWEGCWVSFGGGKGY
ncbi:hypothetical protein Q3G72_007942 [Acer saccharum]|nr:hypothetical protein Q3G72_007942 [Acer saccharum]